jgi:hypothetical protein
MLSGEKLTYRTSLQLGSSGERKCKMSATTCAVDASTAQYQISQMLQSYKTV